MGEERREGEWERRGGERVSGGGGNKMGEEVWREGE